MRKVGCTLGRRTCGSLTSRLALALVVAVLVGGSLPLSAGAQGPACDRVRIVDAVSNVDLVVRCPDGEIRMVRVAGLQVWPEGWPLADPELNRITLADRVAQAARGGALLLSPAVGRAPNGAEVRVVSLPNGRGSLAEIMASQGWAMVARDADAMVPDLAPALRDAESAARAGRRGIWDVSLDMVAYTAPNGRTIEVDRRLVPALNLLAGMDLAQPLLNSLADARIPVFLFAEAPELEAWAHYDDRGRVIWVHSSLRGADPRTIAVVLAHEATHAQDHHQGRFDTGRIRTAAAAQACYETEIRAFSIELEIWSQLFGSEGKSPEVHRLEREANILLSDYGYSPEALQDEIRRLYRGQCRVRA
jgi:hypothetical protein